MGPDNGGEPPNLAVSVCGGFIDREGRCGDGVLPRIKARLNQDPMGSWFRDYFLSTVHVIILFSHLPWSQDGPLVSSLQPTTLGLI